MTIEKGYTLNILHNPKYYHKIFLEGDTQVVVLWFIVYKREK